MKKLITVGLGLTFFLQSIPAHAYFNDYYNLTTARGYELSSSEAFMGNVGDWLQLAIPLSGLVYSTAIGDYEGDKQWAKAVGSTWVTTEILKYTIAEERPSQPDNEKGRTFPSGHTSFAFAGASYWQMRYGWYIGAPMYAAAAFVGYSRVRVKAHNWADVSTAAALGIGFNLIFTSKYIPEGVNVTAMPTDGGAYIGFSTRF